MSYLVLIGDLHLNDNYLWSLEVCENIIQYLINAPFNNSDNIGIFLGDLTENPLNSGAVFDMLRQLFENLKFKAIYIIVGNHDLRRRGGKITVPYDFLKNQVHICSSPGEIITINGFSCLMLPHFLPTVERPSVNKFYSSLEGNFDFIFGHVADETIDIIPENQKADLSKLRGIKCLGHIHSRVSAHCVGSIFPNNIREVDPTRAIWLFDRGKNKREVRLPTFLEYENVTYPNYIMRTKALTSVYSFYGADEGAIREKYGDVYIRKIVKNINSNLKSDLHKASKLTTFKDVQDTVGLIDKWAETLEKYPSENLIKTVKKYAY